MERTIHGPDPELLSVEEAAKWLGIPKTTFKGWIDEKRIPLPRKANQAVQFYSWDVVFSMRVLLAMGFLPLGDSENGSDS